MTVSLRMPSPASITCAPWCNAHTVTDYQDGQPHEHAHVGVWSVPIPHGEAEIALCAIDGAQEEPGISVKIQQGRCTAEFSGELPQLLAGWSALSALLAGIIPAGGVCPEGDAAESIGVAA